MPPKKKCTNTQSKIVRFLLDNQKNNEDGSQSQSSTSKSVIGKAKKNKNDNEKKDTIGGGILTQQRSVARNKTLISDSGSDDDKPCTSKKALRRLAAKRQSENLEAKNLKKNLSKRPRKELEDSDVASDVDDASVNGSPQYPSKRQRIIFELNAPHHTKRGQENTMFLLFQARQFDGEITYPISFPTFKKYVNVDEVALEVLKIIHNGGIMNYEDFKDNKECLEKIKKDFYMAFFIYPVIRQRFSWILSWQTPIQTKKKFLLIPRRTETKYDEYIAQEIRLEKMDVICDDTNTPIIATEDLEEIDAEEIVQTNSRDPAPPKAITSTDITSNTESELSNENLNFKKQYENLDESVMPITLKEFQDYTNSDEVLKIFMKDKYKDKLEEKEKTKKHQKFVKFVRKVMYSNFYTNPLSRFRWPLQYLRYNARCPKNKRDVIFDIPEKYLDDTFISRIAKYKNNLDLNVWFPLHVDPLLLDCIPFEYEIFERLVSFEKRYNQILSYIQKCISERNYEKLLKQNELQDHLLRFHYQNYFLDEDIRSLGSLHFKPCPSSIRDKFKVKPRQILEIYEKYKDSMKDCLMTLDHHNEEINAEHNLNPCSDAVDLINNNNENKENSNILNDGKGSIESDGSCDSKSLHDIHLTSILLNSEAIQEIHSVIPEPDANNAQLQIVQNSINHLENFENQRPSEISIEDPRIPATDIQIEADCTSTESQAQMKDGNINQENLLSKIRYHLPLIENFSKYQQLFPIEYESFKHYAKLDALIDEIIENLSRMVSVEEFLTFTDNFDLRERTCRYLYEQYFVNPSARNLFKITFSKSTPLDLLAKVNEFARIAVEDDAEEEGEEEEISSTCSEASSHSSADTVKLYRAGLTLPKSSSSSSLAETDRTEFLKFIPKTVEIPHDMIYNYIAMKLKDSKKLEQVIRMAKSKMINKISEQDNNHTERETSKPDEAMQDLACSEQNPYKSKAGRLEQVLPSPEQNRNVSKVNTPKKVLSEKSPDKSKAENETSKADGTEQELPTSKDNPNESKGDRSKQALARLEQNPNKSNTINTLKVIDSSNEILEANIELFENILITEEPDKHYSKDKNIPKPIIKKPTKVPTEPVAPLIEKPLMEEVSVQTEQNSCRQRLIVNETTNHNDIHKESREKNFKKPTWEEVSLTVSDVNIGDTANKTLEEEKSASSVIAENDKSADDQILVRSVNSDESSQDASMHEENITQEKLNRITSIYFQTVEKSQCFSYILASTYGLQHQIFKVITEISFDEFLKYTRILEGESLYTCINDNFKDILKSLYTFAFVEQKTFPINLYVPLRSLIDLLQLKKISIQHFDLSLVVPNILHWSDLLCCTNYVQLVFLERLKTYENEDLIEDCDDYYYRCWKSNKWIHNHIPDLIEPSLKNRTFIFEGPLVAFETIEKRLKTLNAEKLASSPPAPPQNENKQLDDWDIEVISLSSSEENLEGSNTLETPSKGENLCDTFIEPATGNVITSTQLTPQSRKKQTNETEISNCEYQETQPLISSSQLLVINKPNRGDNEKLVTQPLRSSPNLFQSCSGSTNSSNLQKSGEQNERNCQSPDIIESNFINMPNTMQQIEMLPPDEILNPDPLNSSGITKDSLNLSQISKNIKREKDNAASKTLNNLRITINDEDNDDDTVLYETLNEEVIEIDDENDTEVSQSSLIDLLADKRPPTNETLFKTMSSLSSNSTTSSSFRLCEAQKFPSIIDEIPLTLNKIKTQKMISAPPAHKPSSLPDNAMNCIPLANLSHLLSQTQLVAENSSEQAKQDTRNIPSNVACISSESSITNISSQQNKEVALNESKETGEVDTIEACSEATSSIAPVNIPDPGQSLPQTEKIRSNRKTSVTKKDTVKIIKVKITPSISDIVPQLTHQFRPLPLIAKKTAQNVKESFSKDNLKSKIPQPTKKNLSNKKPSTTAVATVEAAKKVNPLKINKAISNLKAVNEEENPSEQNQITETISNLNLNENENLITSEGLRNADLENSCARCMPYQDRKTKSATQSTLPSQKALMTSHALDGDSSFFRSSQLLKVLQANDTTSVCKAGGLPDPVVSNTSHLSSNVINQSKQPLQVIFHKTLNPNCNQAKLTIPSYPQPEKKAIYFRRIFNFHYFDFLTIEHIKKYELASNGMGQRYQGAVIHTGHERVKVYGQITRSLAPNFPFSFLNDLNYVLNDMKEFHFELGNRKFKISNHSSDLRVRILEFLFLHIPVFGHWNLIFDDSFKEWCRCETIPSHAYVKPKIKFKEFLLKSIDPEILESMAALKASL